MSLGRRFSARSKTGSQPYRTASFATVSSFVTLTSTQSLAVGLGLLQSWLPTLPEASSATAGGQSATAWSRSMRLNCMVVSMKRSSCTWEGSCLQPGASCLEDPQHRQYGGRQLYWRVPPVLPPNTEYLLGWKRHGVEGAIVSVLNVKYPLQRRHLCRALGCPLAAASAADTAPSDIDLSPWALRSGTPVACPAFLSTTGRKAGHAAGE
mmetsp:Transcript_38545/g.108994  ORF Transcript_38545/g.108994 Transcript_38545/m.108994 type:complete len:209 (+) Transcript_38545:529-1155(+)